MTIAPSSTPEELAALPEWARGALSTAESRTIHRPSYESLRQSAAWPLLLDAALVSTFLPRQLAPEACPESERSAVENAVLEYSEPVTTPEGTRWELRRSVRAEVLRLAPGPVEIARSQALSSSVFSDAVSMAVHEILSGTSLARLDSAGLPQLEALRAAASMLGDVQSLHSRLPLTQLDRLIRKRRLAEQFERVCGKDFKTEVVGRDGELEVLRAYVGVIAASSLRDTAVRALSFARRKVSGRKPLVIWGTGGVGKTTLLSRFMLEHIDAADGSYPFAYLDFDRPSISPKDHVGLFAEICLQMSAQFEGLDGPLRELRDEALENQFDGPSTDSESRLELLVESFRQRVDVFLGDQESRFEWERPVLIVLDTLEVVQYDANQVLHLERFLRPFVKSGWSRLRLVVAGRKRVDNLGTDDEPMELEPMELEGLDAPGASELLMRLATRADKELRAKAAAELAGLLAIRRGMLGKSKVHPLRLRIVGSIFQQQDSESGEDIARSLIDELQNGLRGGGSATRALINGILIRRIIDHVADPRVRALADPGLVVRRITPDVIARVMALGTPRPGSLAVEDAIAFEPWNLTSEEAEDIYRAFSREVALVERDGTVLRHRQDVRSEMLPLIRARSPQRFALLHRLAFEHFNAAVAATAMPDEAATAEAVYHGLWCGEPLELLDALWKKGQVSNARIDPEEFEPDSLPVLFLKARNREGLTVEEVTRLPPHMAQDWAIAFGEQFLLAADPAAAFQVILTATGRQLDVLRDNPALLAAGARLLYRAGAWHDSATLVRYLLEHVRWPIPGSSRPVQVDLIRLLAHLDAKSGVDLSLPWNVEFEAALQDQAAIARIEVAAHLAISNHSGSFGMLDSVMHGCSRRDWLSSRRVLRLAILASQSLRPDLIALWVRSSERFPRFEQGKASREELLEDFLTEALSFHSGSQFDGKKRTWRQSRVDVAKRVEVDPTLAAAVRYAMVFDHSDWQTVFGNALARALTLSRQPLTERLRKHGFIPSRGPANGRGIVRMVVQEGRLLDLAAVVAYMPDDTPYSTLPLEWRMRPDTSRHPYSLPGLAQALLRWHDQLLNRFMEGMKGVPPHQGETVVVPAAPLAVETVATEVRQMPPTEADVADLSIDNLISRFWQLSASQMRDITLELRLITRADLQIPPHERYQNALILAKEKGLLVELARQIEKYEKNA